MNVLKNFEAVFAVALAVAVSASYVTHAPRQAVAAMAQPASTAVATPTQMAVVAISAKRMSALEKRRSLEDERRVVRPSANGIERT